MDKFTNPELFSEMTRLLKAADRAGEGPGKRWMTDALGSLGLGVDEAIRKLEPTSISTSHLMKTPMADIKSAMSEKLKEPRGTAAWAPAPSSVESSRCRVTSAMWVQDKYPEYRSGKSNARDQLLDALKRMKFRLAEEEAEPTVELDLAMLTPVGRTHVRLEKMVDLWSNTLHSEMRKFLEAGGYEARKAAMTPIDEYESLTLEGAETPVEPMAVMMNEPKFKSSRPSPLKAAVTPKDQDSLDDAVNFETNPDAGSW